MDEVTFEVSGEMQKIVFLLILFFPPLASW